MWWSLVLGCGGAEDDLQRRLAQREALREAKARAAVPNPSRVGMAVGYFKDQVHTFTSKQQMAMQFAENETEAQARVQRLEQALAEEPGERAFIEQLDRAKQKLERAQRRPFRSTERPVLGVLWEGLECTTGTDCTVVSMGCCGDTPVACNTMFYAEIKPSADALISSQQCGACPSEPPRATCLDGACQVEGGPVVLPHKRPR